MSHMSRRGDVRLALVVAMLAVAAPAQADEHPIAAGEAPVAEGEHAVPEAPDDPPAAAYDDMRPPGRTARRFSLLVGMGLSHGDVGASWFPDVGVYGRLTDWASIGLRVHGWVGASSIDGALLRLALAVPSVRVHFREDLASWATLELGVHADGGLALDWSETRRLGGDALLFGLGAGAFVSLELGEVSGVTLDYTMMAYGVGGTDVRTEASVTLSYTARWD